MEKTEIELLARREGKSHTQEFREYTYFMDNALKFGDKWRSLCVVPSQHAARELMERVKAFFPEATILPASMQIRFNGAVMYFKALRGRTDVEALRGFQVPHIFNVAPVKPELLEDLRPIFRTPHLEVFDYRRLSFSY